MLEQGGCVLPPQHHAVTLEHSVVAAWVSPALAAHKRPLCARRRGRRSAALTWSSGPDLAPWSHPMCWELAIK